MLMGGHPRRAGHLTKDESGFTLIELAIATVLSVMIVFAGSALLINTTQSTNTLAAMANLDSKVNVSLGQATGALDNAQPLGYCMQDVLAGNSPSYLNINYSTAWADCFRSSSWGPALYAATDSGMCFYSYAGSTSTTLQVDGVSLSNAPDLECIWVDSSSQLWVSTWQPTNAGTGTSGPTLGPTYTTCSPAADGSTTSLCWEGAGVPPYGTVPTNTVGCGAPGNTCILIGTLAAPASGGAPWFSYYSSSGALNSYTDSSSGVQVTDSAGSCNATGNITVVSPAIASDLTNCLMQISQVKFDVVAQNTPQSYSTTTPLNYSYVYTANLWGMLYQGQQCWDASGAAQSCEVTANPGNGGTGPQGSGGTSTTSTTTGSTTTTTGSTTTTTGSTTTTTGSTTTTTGSTTTTTLPIGAPTGLTASVSSSNRITFNWAAPSNTSGLSIIDYRLYNDGIYTGVDTGGGSTTLVYNGSSLTAGNPYVFTVRAVITAALSAPSNPAIVTTYNTPATPTGLGATAGTQTVTLNWTPDTITVATPVTGYYVRYSSTGSTGPWTQAPNVTPGTAGSTVVSGLTPGTEYWFEIAAYSSPTATPNVSWAGYTSPYTATVTAVPTNDPTPAGIIALVGQIGEEGPTYDYTAIDWTAVTGAQITGYNVYVNGVLAQTISGISTVTWDCFQYRSCASFPDGITVEVQLASVDSSGGTSTLSNPIYVTPSKYAAIFGPNYVLAELDEPAGSNIINSTSWVNATGTVVGSGVTLGVPATPATYLGPTVASFSGTSGSYIDIPMASTAFGGLTNMAISAWVNLGASAPANDATIVSRLNYTGGTTPAGTTGPGGTPGWVLYENTSGHICAYFAASATSYLNGGNALCTTSPYNDGNWHDVAFGVSEGISGSLYIDSSLAATAPWTGTYTALPSTPSGWLIGTSADANLDTSSFAFPFTGQIADVGGQWLSNAGYTLASAGYATATGIPDELAAMVSSGQVTLSWVPPDQATSETVYNDGTPVYSGSPSYTDTGLTNGDTYTFYVTATSAAGTFTSSSITVTLETGPTLTVVPANGQMALSWTSTAGATAYELYQNQSCTGTPIYSGSSLNYTDTGLANGVLYSFCVAAVTPNETVASTSVTAAYFAYTGSIQSFVVPSGVPQVAIAAYGAQGGGTSGGQGGAVTATLNVSQSQTVDVYAGGQGAANATSAFTGGGSGGYFVGTYSSYGSCTVGEKGNYGYGGGGYSGAYVNASEQVIAGGGGGSGSAGYVSPSSGGAGGGVGAGTAGAISTNPDGSSEKGTPGGGASLTSGGAAGANYSGLNYTSPAAGTSGQGGSGGITNDIYCEYNPGGGGGGGGGIYGGGGGGGDYEYGTSAGGGGGSGTLVGGMLITSTAGANSGNGYVTVVYPPPPPPPVTVTVTGPANAAAGTAITTANINATLSAGEGSPSGNITFSVFGPQTAAPTACTTGGTTVGTTTAVNGTGTYNPNATYTPTIAGDYWWYASYSGDTNNTATTSPCGPSMSETVVGAGAPSQLAFTSQPGGGADAAVWATQPQVSVKDANGNVATSASTPITLSIASQPDTGATLSCTTNPLSATSGVATFAGCQITGKTGTYTLSATGTYTGATSTSFSITIGPVNQLAFTTQPGGGATGSVWTTQPAVSAEDAGGNVVTSSSASITLAIASQPGTGAGLSCTTNPVAATSGVATFAGCQIAGTAGSYTLNATAAGLTATTSSAFSVTYGTATQLVLTTQPGNTTESNFFSPEPVVTIEDSLGNTVTNYSGTVTLAINSYSPGSGGSTQGTLVGTTAIISSGVASFVSTSYITGTAAAGTYTLKATNGSLTAATSNNVVISAQTASKLMFTSQPGGGTDGITWSTQPAVTVEDPSGNTVTSASGPVTLAIYQQPASGATLSCTTNPMAATSGVATFAGCQIAGTVGSNYELSAAYSGLATSPSTAFSITIGSASKMAFTSQPVGNVAEQASFSTSPTAAVEDIGGNIITTNNGNVTLAVNSYTAGNGGSAPGTISCANPGFPTVAASSGSAAFSLCNISGTAAAGTYTLKATGQGLTAATSSPLSISAGSAAQFVFTTQPVGGVTEGTNFPTQPVVTVEDLYSNVVTSSSTPITLGISTFSQTNSGTTQGTLSCVNSGLTVSASSGVSTFSGCQIAGTSAGGTYTLKATGSSAQAQSSNVVINVGSASKLMFTTQPGGGANGAALNTQPAVTVTDTYGNAIASPSATVTLAVTTGNGTLSCSANPVTTSSGVATFSGCQIVGTIGSYTLSATASGLSTVTSNPLTLTYGAATKLAFTTQPGNEIQGSSGPQATVTVEDSGNNTIANNNSTSVTLSVNTYTAGSGGTTAGSMSGGITGTAVNGVVAFINAYVGGNKNAGTYTINATASGLATATSTSFTVSPGPAYQMVFTTQPGGTTANGAVLTTQPVVTIEDQWQNIETSSSATITLAVATQPGTGATLSCTGGLSQAATSGVATFAGCQIVGQTGSYTLSATIAGPVTATSSAFTLTYGTATQLVFTTQPGGGADGANLNVQPVVAVEDSGHNVVTNSTAPVTLGIASQPGSGAALSCTTNPVAATSGVATFAGCQIVGQAGSYTLSATIAGPVTATSSAFTLTYGTATQLVFTTQPGGGAYSATWGTQPTIKVEDSGGDLVTNSSASVTLGVASQPGSGAALSCTINPLSASSGVATFAGCQIAGTAGSYTISASASGLTGTTSTSFTVTSVVSGAPTGLSATVNPSNQITFNWTAPSSNGGSAITSYQIWNTTLGTEAGQTANGSTTTLTYSGAGLAQGTAYNFVVEAVNGAGTSAASGAVPATIYGIPAVPTAVNASSTSSGATVTWVADNSTTATPVNGYRVYSATTSGGPWTLAATVTPATATSASITGLAGGVTYWFEVAAYSTANSGYTSANSTPAVAAVAGSTSGDTTPTVVALKVGNAVVTVTWTAVTGSPASGTYTGYDIYANGVLITTVSGEASTSSLLAGLSNGTTYSIQMSSADSNGGASASTAVQYVTPSIYAGQVLSDYGAGANAFWQLDEPSGATVSSDVSASRYFGMPVAGLVTPGASSTPNPLIGTTSYLFTPGTSTNNNALIYNNATITGYSNNATSTLLNPEPFTVQAWVNASSTLPASGHYVGIVNKFTHSNPNGWDLYENSSGDVCGTYVVNTSTYIGSSINGICSTASSGNGTGYIAGTGWQLLTFTVNSSGATLYDNATSVATGSWTGSATSISGNGNNIRVGWEPVGSTGYGFVGNIADVSLSTVTAVTPAELTAEFTDVVPAGAPQPPTLSGTPSNRQVALTWTQTIGASSYTLYQGGAQIYSGPANTYVAPNLTNNTPYSFDVTATGTGGTSPASNTVIYTPEAVPGAPTGVTASLPSTPYGGDALVSWTAPTGLQTPQTPVTYDVYANGTLALIGASNTSVTVGGLMAASYTFTVTAIDSYSQMSVPSAASNAVTTTALTAFISTDETPSIVAVSENPLASTASTTTISPSGATGLTAEAVTPDGQYLWVSNYLSNTISVIQISTGTLTSTITTGGHPQGIVFNSAGTNAWVANAGLNEVQEFSANHTCETSTSSPCAVVGTPVTLTTGTAPNGITISPNGNFVYVASTNSGGAVTEISTGATPAIIATVTVGTNPEEVAAPNNNTLYVTNYSSNTVTVISVNPTTSALTVTASINVGVAPQGIVASPDGNYVYVADEASNNVEQISTSNNTVTAVITVGSSPIGIGITPDGNYLYTANYSSANISVVSVSSLSQIALISSGANTQPYGVALTGTGGLGNI